MKTPVTDWTKVKSILDLPKSIYNELTDCSYGSQVNDELTKYAEIFKPKEYTVNIKYTEYTKDLQDNTTSVACHQEFKEFLLNPDAEFLFHYYGKKLNSQIDKSVYDENYNRREKTFSDKYIKIERVRIGTEAWNRYISEYVPNFKPEFRDNDYSEIYLCLENMRGAHNYKLPGKTIVVNSLIAKRIQNSGVLDKLPIDYKNNKYDDSNILYFGTFYDIPVGVHSGINIDDQNIYNDELEVIGKYEANEDFFIMMELRSQLYNICEKHGINNIVINEKYANALLTDTYNVETGYPCVPIPYEHIYEVGNFKSKKIQIFVNKKLDAYDNTVQFLNADKPAGDEPEKIGEIKFLHAENFNKIINKNKK